MSSTMVSSALLITAKVKGSCFAILGICALPFRQRHRRFARQLRKEIAAFVDADCDIGRDDHRAVVALDDERSCLLAAEGVAGEDRRRDPAMLGPEIDLSIAGGGFSGLRW